MLKELRPRQKNGFLIKKNKKNYVEFTRFRLHKNLMYLQVLNKFNTLFAKKFKLPRSHKHILSF